MVSSGVPPTLLFTTVNGRMTRIGDTVSIHVYRWPWKSFFGSENQGGLWFEKKPDQAGDRGIPPSHSWASPGRPSRAGRCLVGHETTGLLEDPLGPLCGPDGAVEEGPHQAPQIFPDRVGRAFGGREKLVDAPIAGGGVRPDSNNCSKPIGAEGRKSGSCLLGAGGYEHELLPWAEAEALSLAARVAGHLFGGQVLIDLVVKSSSVGPTTRLLFSKTETFSRTKIPCSQSSRRCARRAVIGLGLGPVAWVVGKGDGLASPSES